MTYVGGGGNSVLGLFIEMVDEEEEEEEEIRVVPRIESDHLPVVVKLRGMNETERNKRRNGKDKILTGTTESEGAG